MYCFVSVCVCLYRYTKETENWESHILKSSAVMIPIGLLFLEHGSSQPVSRGRVSLFSCERAGRCWRFTDPPASLLPPPLLQSASSRGSVKTWVTVAPSLRSLSLFFSYSAWWKEEKLVSLLPYPLRHTTIYREEEEHASWHGLQILNKKKRERNEKDSCESAYKLFFLLKKPGRLGFFFLGYLRSSFEVLVVVTSGNIFDVKVRKIFFFVLRWWTLPLSKQDTLSSSGLLLLLCGVGRGRWEVLKVSRFSIGCGGTTKLLWCVAPGKASWKREYETRPVYAIFALLWSTPYRHHTKQQQQQQQTRVHVCKHDLGECARKISFILFLLSFTPFVFFLFFVIPLRTYLIFCTPLSSSPVRKKKRCLCLCA